MEVNIETIEEEKSIQIFPDLSGVDTIDPMHGNLEREIIHNDAIHISDDIRNNNIDNSFRQQERDLMYENVVLFVYKLSNLTSAVLTLITLYIIANTRFDIATTIMNQGISKYLPIVTIGLIPSIITSNYFHPMVDSTKVVLSLTMFLVTMLVSPIVWTWPTALMTYLTRTVSILGSVKVSFVSTLLGQIGNAIWALGVLYLSLT